MTAESDQRYRRAQAIVHEVLELPARERNARIATACGGDVKLQREVDWLIASAEITGPDPLAHVVETAQATLADARVEASAAHRYRLVGRLGEGGMGQVWLAERTDGDARQRVALKLLHGAGRPGAAALARFVAEGRILAALNHPNIAHLIDSGRGADGEPFLAMEYIDGTRIDRWCDAHAPSLRTRIELFLKVCAAVEYAHGQLVIHRDLKPANILVTADGEPKLLDFGIARLLDPQRGSGTATTMLHAMTLAYASPEQIEGGTLGTATDVYSLGVVLYELVAGRRPFAAESEHALSNAIVSGEVARPSQRRSRATGAWPSRRVPPDIDAIVLKAMRREPLQRYASVAEFGDDLRRHLAARPVLARRGQHWYQAQRFVWRNRWASAAACALLALGATYLFEREAQRRRVELERDRAEAVVRFTGDLFDAAGSLRTRGNAVSVREMLDRGATELQARTDLPDAIKGALLLSMGRAYNSLSLGKEALPLLQSARSLLASTDPAERAAQIGAIGVAKQLQGRQPEAIAAYEEASALLRDAPGTHADELAEWRVRVAGLHADMVDLPIEQSIAELGRIVAGLEHAPRHSEDVLLRAYSELAAAYVVANDGTRAVPMAERANDLAARLYGRDDMRAAKARKNLALTLMDREPARAATLLGELLAEYDRFSGTPSITRAGLLYNQGKSLRLSMQLPQAASALEQAVASASELGGARHRLTLAALDELGVIYNLSGAPAKTQELLGKALPDFAEAARSGNDGERDCHAMALGTLGEAERMSGRLDEAARHLAQADAILGKLDVDGFKDDMLDLLDWTTQLQLDRSDPVAAQATLDRYDALLRRQSPVSLQRSERSRDLHARLEATAGTLTSSRIAPNG